MPKKPNRGSSRTPAELYAAAVELDGAFLANVVLGQHSNVSRKLRGLVRLLESGHDVSTGQFSIDVLMVDGQKTPWEVLEHVGPDGEIPSHDGDEEEG